MQTAIGLRAIYHQNTTYTFAARQKEKKKQNYFILVMYMIFLLHTRLPQITDVLVEKIT